MLNGNQLSSIALFLIGLTVFSFAGCQKKRSAEVIMPPCSYSMEIGSYTDNTADEVLSAMLPFFQEIDSTITPDDLEIVSPVYLNYTTTPPTPAEGEIFFPLRFEDGSTDESFFGRIFRCN